MLQAIHEAIFLLYNVASIKQTRLALQRST